MFNLSDAEALLIMQNREDRAFAARQINVGNANVRRLNSALAEARTELAAVRAELAREKARRHAAEFAARRH
jgi:hypothetical protein